MTAPRQPEPIVACEQLARMWSMCYDYALPLRYADPVTETGEPEARRLYTIPLPKRDHRESPACSILVAPAGAPGGQTTTTPIGMRCVAHGATEREAMDVLRDLRRIILPGGRGWTHNPPTPGGSFNPQGVIGPPFVAPSGDADVWRFVSIDIVADIQPVNFAFGAATPEGEAAAQLDLVAHCIPDVMPAPLVGFSVHHTTATSASVVIAENTLTLSFASGGPITENTFDLTHEDYDTVAELRAAVTALGTWTVDDADAATDARLSVELFHHTNSNPIGAANKSLLRLHA